ncbi:MAG: ABC transporter permease [Anaerolineae bacterium]|nr:ABC transporter permease [Anaerolineae bacterium]
MKILDLAFKDLYQILRDLRSLLFLVAMPIVFTLFMGFAYNAGESGNESVDARLGLAYVDPEQDSRLSQMLFARLEASDTLRVVRLEQAEALESLRRGEVAGVLVVPSGFGGQDDVGTAPQLKLIAESNSSDGQSLYQLLRVPVSQLMSAVEIASISADVQGNPAEFSPALELAWAKWDENSHLERVRLERAVAQPTENWFGDNPYNQASPGILVQFAIMGLVTSAQILVNERKTRTLQRLMTTAMRPWEIVAGHLLAMFGLVFLQTAMLVIFGQFALGVDYLREPLGTLLVSLALGLWVASMGLLIGVLANSDDQVVLFSMIAMFLFSALGGAWFPLETSGGAFAALGRLMPSAWAMTGYQNILIRGLDFSSILLPTGILLAYAAGFFLLAVWRFMKMDV